MKILILTNSFGGLYNFRFELIQKLLSENEIWISTTMGDHADDFENLGCHIIDTKIERHGTNPFEDLRLLGFYIKLIKKVSPDVVFTYTVKPNIYGGLACKFKKVPFFANITGLGVSLENESFIQRIVLFLYRLSLKNAKHVFFQNSSNMDFMKKHKTVGEDITLLPGSGVNLEKFLPQEFPSIENGVNFLFIGRIMKDKGFDELLQAAKVIKSKYDNISFDIVGKFVDDYKDVVDSSVNEGLVNFHGKQIDVKPFLAKSHCVILPSYHEGMSNVLLEAAASGRPVITTNVPGCRETFDEGVSGFGCEAKDVDSLVNAIEKFLSLTCEEMKTMGVAGRSKMEKQFNRNIIIDTYFKELQKL